MNTKTRCLVILLLFSLSACGYHLRGSSPKKTRAEVAKVFVADKRASTVALKVREQLSLAGAKPAKEIEKARYVLNLERERFEQTVLSVSAVTGKVEEYQLSLSLFISLREVGGAELVAREEIKFAKDYTFDEDAVLGTFEEEEAINAELVDLAADEIIRRLNTEAGDN